MRHEEAKFTTKLQKWLKYNWKYSGPIEVKVSYGKTFNYNSGFKHHQLRNLINARKDVCITYKISDLDRMEKPWDLDCYFKSHSYVVLRYVNKDDNKFYIINPITIQGEIDDGKKSLTEERAKLIADVIGQLK